MEGTIILHLDIIVGRFHFNLVENEGIYSVYHYFDGSYGQKNFEANKEGAENFMDAQCMCIDLYKALIGKRDKLILRLAPISNKLDAVNRQINALILR